MEEVLNELAEEYGFDYHVVYYAANVLRYYDFVRNGDEELFLACLEMLLQGLSSMEFMKKEKHFNVQDDINYMVMDALYRTYGDIALPYIDKDYTEFNMYRI